MTSPLVSVIIPNYNHAPYLLERIDSVLGQTYQNFELIILDDCSTDNSHEVIEKYRNNSHVSYIVYNEFNSGQIFSQWHKGMELAKGDLIWIAESDDKCKPDFLETLVHAIGKNADNVVAFCDSIIFDDNGNENPEKNFWQIEEGNYKGTEFISNYLSRGGAIANASSAIFKKDTALNLPKNYMDFKGAGDRFFWTLMAEKGGVVYVDKKMNYFRSHPNNSTKRNYATGINQREDFSILKYILEKGYITRKYYNELRRNYCWTFVFRGLPKGELQTNLLHLYGYNYWGIQWLRVLSFFGKN